MCDSAIRALYQFLTTIGYTHPVHPILVHMTVGLVEGALVLAVAGVLFRRKTLPQSARHCVILAFFLLLPTVLLGVLDWKHFYAAAWLTPIKMKFILAVVLFALLSLGVFATRRVEVRSVGVLSIYGLCLLNVIGMGYFGGELVYGAKRAPLSDDFSAGERSYKTHCSACHPNGGNTFDPDKPVIGSHEIADVNSFLAFIRDPDAPMPPFPETKISKTQAMDLYQYIVHELKK